MRNRPGILLTFNTPGRHRRVRATDLRAFLVQHQMPIPEELGAGKVTLLVIDDGPRSVESVKRSFKSFAPRTGLSTTGPASTESSSSASSGPARR